MDIRQLRYFYTIAKEGQISKAAKKLHIAQPPLSQSLKALEEELDVLLFERQGRKMHLTTSGSVLFKRAEEILQIIDEAIDEVRDAEQGLKGTLAIGCVKSFFANLPEKINKFRQLYPNLTFHLRVGDSYSLVELIKNREVDIAFIRLPAQLEPFSYRMLPDEPYVVAVPEDWAKQFPDATISLEEMTKYPLILLRRIYGVGQYEIILNEFNEQGLKPNVIADCPNVDVILEMVSHGIGMSIVPQTALKARHLQGVNMLTLRDRVIISKSAVIWLKNRYLPNSAKRFIDLFKTQQ